MSASQDMRVRTFVRWCNAKLQQRGLRIDNFVEDVGDGITLIDLWEIASKKTVSGVNRKPGNKRFLKMANMTLLLDAIKRDGVPVPGITKEHLVEAQVSPVLELLWTLIRAYHLNHAAVGVTTGSLDSKTEAYKGRALRWIKEKLSGYNVKVEDLNDSWRDGRTFCALVHSLEKGALDFSTVSQSNAIGNLDLAFTSAEQRLGIPRLLDASDFQESSTLDEASLLTYLAYFVNHTASEFKIVLTPRIDYSQSSSDLALEEKETSPVNHRNALPPPSQSPCVMDSPTTVVHHFFHRCAEYPEMHAFSVRREEHWKRKTWDQYRLMVSRAARAMIAFGLQPGDKICIFGKTATRPEWNIFSLASMAVGAIPCIGHSYNTPELLRQLERTQAPFLLLEKHSQYKKIKSELKEFSFLKLVIVKEGTVPPNDSVITWRIFNRKGELRKGCRDKEIKDLDSELENRIKAITPVDTACIVFTPGTETEGADAPRGKGVVLSHRSILFTAKMLADSLNVVSEDCYVSFLSMAQISEQMLALYVPILTGMSVFYVPDASTLHVAIREVQPTIIAAPPDFWLASFHAMKDCLPPTGTADMPARVLDQVRKSVACGRARHALVGGNSQPVPRAVFQFFATLGVELIHCYGQAETCGLATWTLGSSMTQPTGDENSCGLASVGKPVSGCEIKLAEDGEILVRGPQLFTGYFSNESLTANSLDDGWFHTGDLGKLDEQGHLTWIGRRADAIKLADGTVINPVPLETALRCIPLMRNAIVVGKGREFLAALLIVDVSLVKRAAKKRNCPPKKLFSNAEFQAQMKAITDQINKTEAVGLKKWSIVPRSLTIKRNELTPTMSLRRDAVINHFEREIESFYENDTAKDDRKEEDEAEAGRKNKLTDGTFYKKLSDGSFEKTELNQSTVEDMERQLMAAMKEIRELAKKIKTLQELHGEDENMIKAKETATKKLDLEFQALAGASFSPSASKQEKANAAQTKTKPRSRSGDNGSLGNGDTLQVSTTSLVAEIPISASDDKERKRSKRFERRSSPNFSAKEGKKADGISKDSKDEKEKEPVREELAASAGKKEKDKDAKDKEGKDKEAKDDGKKSKDDTSASTNSNLLSSLLKSGKKRDRSVRQKRSKEGGDQIARATSNE